MMTRIPCVLMRGGTSRGPYFLASDLPADERARDEVLLSVMGSGHELEIDGIGGGNPLTSKVAIVSPSMHPEAQIDYLFVQVLVTERRVDTAPNCGNMLAGVGPFAIEAGLVPAVSPETTVRIRNVNTGKLIEAVVQTPNGRVSYEGDTSIDGVPGTAAPIRLTFLDAAGAKTGRLFPTGRHVDTVQGCDITCIDMATPMVLIAAASLGKSGHETADALDGDRTFMARLEAIRREAGALMGMGDVTHSVLPKPVLLAEPVHGGTISARYFMPHACHKAIATTGAIGIATACVVEGTVAQRLLGASAAGLRTIAVEHPRGRLEVALQADPQGSVEALRASVIRTAKRLFDGAVYVSDAIFGPAGRAVGPLVS